MKSATLKILSLIMMFAVLIGVTSCSLTGGDEEETTEPTTLASATPLMAEGATEEAIAYFNTLMAKINSGKASLKYSSNYDPKGFDCENSALKAALPTIVKLMKGGFNADLGAEVAYGEPLANYIPVKNDAAALALTADDIVEIAVNKEAYSRAAEEESKVAADENYTTASAIVVDEDVRKITITLKDETDPAAGEGLFGKIYNIPDRKLIADEMAKMSEYMTYDGNYSAKYTGCTIYMEINRITDEVIKLEFNRNIEVTATVTGVGTLASVGTQEIKFVVNGNDKYEFDWVDPNAVTEAAE